MWENTHTHTHIYIYIYIYVYILVFTDANVYIDIYVCMYTYIYMYKCRRVSARALARALARAFTSFESRTAACGGCENVSWRRAPTKSDALQLRKSRVSRFLICDFPFWSSRLQFFYRFSVAISVSPSRFPECPSILRRDVPMFRRFSVAISICSVVFPSRFPFLRRDFYFRSFFFSFAISTLSGVPWSRFAVSPSSIVKSVKKLRYS